MATQYENQLVEQYGQGMQDLINSERGKKSGLLRGENVDQQDVARLISALQGNSYNGQNVINAVNGTVPTYNYADPYGARASIEQRLGLNEATAAEQAAQANLLNFQDTTRKNINTLRANRDLSTGLEAGFEAQRIREATQQEQVLANQLQLAQNKRLALESKVAQEYEIYNQERAKREDIMLKALQVGANVNMGMSLEELTKAYTKAAKKRAKEEAKDAYKKELKAQLLSLGKSTKGSTKELEKRLKKYNKEALAEAKRREDQEWNMKVAQFNKSMSGGGGGLSSSEIRTKNENAIYSVMSSLPRGADNYTNPNDWKPLLNDWLNADMPATEFFDKFGQFINPSDI